MSLPRPLPLLTTGPVTALVTSLATAVAVLVPAAPAQARPWPGHPDRSLVTHTVRPGETATVLAVRYHAWTRELIRLNRLGPSARVYVGQRLRIPVVVSAARRDPRSRSAHQRPAKRANRTATSSAVSGPRLHATRPAGRGWLHEEMSRQQVRRLIVATARRYGVPPRLALAIAWQESGWQQRRVSSTGALGVMQVMPDTGRWMRLYVGRSLRLRDTHDNVLAGVMTIRVLRANTRLDRRAIAAYYQGLGAVRTHGLFPSTRHYVAAVRAHERRIARTGSPV